MHKFDVKYTYDNYYEYYKFVLIKQRIVKDLVFAALFIGVAIYWWVDQTDTTSNQVLPILSVVFGVAMPMLNLITIPMIKKQLRARQSEIDNTHIVVTFNDEEVVYENLTITPEVEKAPIDVEEKPVEEVSTEALETEVKDESVEVVTTTEEKVEETTTEEKVDDKIFTLKYNNFLSVKESSNLFMFYLDRQTVIILPKNTYATEGELSEFKNFILSKINPRRVKFIKDKVVKTKE